MIQKNLPKLWIKSFLQPKSTDNKYTRGHLLINGGALDSVGATKLAAFAVARSGAWMVTVACDNISLPAYVSVFKSIMAKPMNDQDFFKFINKRKVRAVLMGPGNGISDPLKKRVLQLLKNKKLKVILDADAISVFRDDKKLLLKNLSDNCILTPHEGEFKRIFKLTDSRENSALIAAKESGAIIVLKGYETIVASPDGSVVINKNAPATLASAGTGDVLAGIIYGLAVQNRPLFSAAFAAVYLHSEIANIAGKGMIADDMPGILPRVLINF
jgi:NAD(P)H-hydrate epimerase